MAEAAKSPAAKQGKSIDDETSEKSTLEALGRVELAVAQLMRRAERTDGSRRPAGVPAGLDRAGYLLLLNLSAGGAATINTLAANLGLDGSTVTRQVVSLDKTGHVTRGPHPLDGRAVLVRITPAGSSALARHRTERANLYADVLEHWSPLERGILAELLERLNEDLDAYRKRTP